MTVKREQYAWLYRHMRLASDSFGLSNNKAMKQNFEKICVYFGHFDSWIPLSFVLGFYVSLVVTR